MADAKGYVARLEEFLDDLNNKNQLNTYDKNWNNIRFAVDRFTQSGLFKCDLELSLFREGKSDKDNAESRRLILNSMVLPEVGISWKSSTQLFGYCNPVLNDNMSLKISWNATGAYWGDSVYGLAWKSQYTDDGLLKLKPEKWVAQISYYSTGIDPRSGANVENAAPNPFLTLKGLRFDMPKMSDLQPKSTDFIEMSGTITFTDYQVSLLGIIDR